MEGQLLRGRGRGCCRIAGLASGRRLSRAGRWGGDRKPSLRLLRRRWLLLMLLMLLLDWLTLLRWLLLTRLALLPLLTLLNMLLLLLLMLCLLMCLLMLMLMLMLLHLMLIRLMVRLVMTLLGSLLLLLLGSKQGGVLVRARSDTIRQAGRATSSSAHGRLPMSSHDASDVFSGHLPCSLRRQVRILTPELGLKLVDARIDLGG